MDRASEDLFLFAKYYIGLSEYLYATRRKS